MKFRDIFENNQTRKFKIILKNNDECRKLFKLLAFMATEKEQPWSGAARSILKKVSYKKLDLDDDSDEEFEDFRDEVLDTPLPKQSKYVSNYIGNITIKGTPLTAFSRKEIISISDTFSGKNAGKQMVW